MTYELAKRLKEAGFPQSENNVYGTVGVYNLRAGSNCPKNFSNDCDKECQDNHIYFPTLEELIEACGDRLYSIMRSSGTDINGVIQHTWCAEARDPENDQIIDCADYPTITEAVANLWLALKGK